MTVDPNPAKRRPGGVAGNAGQVVGHAGQTEFKCDKCGQPMLVSGPAAAVAVKCPRCNSEFLVHPGGRVQRRHGSDDFADLPPAAIVHRPPPRAKGFRPTPSPPPEPMPPATSAGGQIYRPIRPKTVRRRDDAKLIRNVVGVFVSVVAAGILVTLAVILGPEMLRRSGLNDRVADLTGIGAAVPLSEVESFLDDRQDEVIRLRNEVSSMFDSDASVPDGLRQSWLGRLANLQPTAEDYALVFGLAPQTASVFERWRRDSEDWTETLGSTVPPENWRQAYPQLAEAFESMVDGQRDLIEQADRFAHPVGKPRSLRDRAAIEAMEIDKFVYRRLYPMMKLELRTSVTSGRSTSGGNALVGDLSRVTEQTLLDAQQRYERLTRRYADSLGDPPLVDDPDYEDLAERFVIANQSNYFTTRFSGGLARFNEARTSLWNR